MQMHMQVLMQGRNSNQLLIETGSKVASAQNKRRRQGTCTKKDTSATSRAA
jgi:hypothetical protein